MSTATHRVHTDHTHVHGDSCGHAKVSHEGRDYFFHEGHLHHVHEDHVDEHEGDVHAVHDGHDGHGHAHGPECGHQSIEHGDHTDYVHDGHRHAQHGDHVDEH